MISQRIGVIGLGYVGLPLSIEFGKKYITIGFDTNAERIRELKCGHDRNFDSTSGEIASAGHLHFSCTPADLSSCNVFIVSVPTPVDENKMPNFLPLVSASETVAKALKHGDIVIYESTVYPGATEEVCVPVLERVSGLKFNTDFFCGYSPERINPGDKERRLTTIPKITSGSTLATAQIVDALYASIIPAGTHLAPSMKVAEAAKVIENTQRDANIALMNEFALIFHSLGIDTHDVLAAASTKWNFMQFKPGLVGGHCIGVDPYYIIQRARTAGYHADLLLACRRLNDNMSKEVASQVIKLMIKNNIMFLGAKVLLLGFTFKENCSDLRNTRVVEMINEFQSYGVQVDIYDPWANTEDATREYGLTLLSAVPTGGNYEGVVLVVAHDQFRDMGIAALRSLGSKKSILYDVKGLFSKDVVDGRL